MRTASSILDSPAAVLLGWSRCWTATAHKIQHRACTTCAGRYCEDNPYKVFAACSVPQEMSDEEIDRAISASEVRF